jgi:hypothetical protein
MAGNHSHPVIGSEEGLQLLLARLEHQSLQPDFQRQRQRALHLALQPYLEPLMTPPLVPLPEEGNLAEWFVYADYLPTDGHYSLIEQVRDLVTEHVPEEERVWLDPLRHSYMDLLEVQQISADIHPVSARLQSLGDQQIFEVLLPATPVPYSIGYVLLTRLLRGPSGIRFHLPGPPLMLSANMGTAVLELTNEMRRDLEMNTGNFGLSEWPEFAKSYGYMMIWSVANVRRGAWTVVDFHMDYLNTQGEPFLYALALYEHHAFGMLADGLYGYAQFTPVPKNGATQAPSETETDTVSWVWLSPQESSDGTRFPVARLTLTPTQLHVEADSPDRLDTIKRHLASTFGFSLHFKGESAVSPQHLTPEVDLLSDSALAPPIVVSQEEEQQILATFLETAYLDWAETPSPALKGQSPRHYCAAQQDTREVATLIDHMELHDPGRRRTGKPAYDYNILRAHIGL